MTWCVELTRTAEKQLRSLDKQVQRAASDLFGRLAQSGDPRASGHGLTGPLAGRWTYRVHGDWRAVAEIHNATVTILVLKIARRDSVYK